MVRRLDVSGDGGIVSDEAGRHDPETQGAPNIKCGQGERPEGLQSLRWLKGHFPLITTDTSSNAMATMFYESLPAGTKGGLKQMMVGKEWNFQSLWELVSVGEDEDPKWSKDDRASPNNKRRAPWAANVVMEETQRERVTTECQICDEPGHTARECSFVQDDPQLVVVPISERRCYNCHDIGHIANDCTKEKKADNRTCYSCGKVGHPSYKCPDRSSRPEQRPRGTGGPPRFGGRERTSSGGPSNFGGRERVSRDNVQCYQCRQYGHYKSDCPQNNGPTGSNSIPLGQRNRSSNERFSKGRLN